MRTLILFVGLMSLALPLSAKIPTFDMTTSEETVAVGEPVTVTVRLHAEIGPGAIKGLVSVFHERDLANRKGGVPVTLEKVSGVLYRGEVLVEEPGVWHVVPFPERGDWAIQEIPDGYPEPVTFRVVERASWGLAVGLGVVFSVLGLWVWRAGRRRLAPASRAASTPYHK